MPPASASFSSRAPQHLQPAPPLRPSRQARHGTPPDTANVYPSVGDVIPDILLPVEGPATPKLTVYDPAPYPMDLLIELAGDWIQVVMTVPEPFQGPGLPFRLVCNVSYRYLRDRHNAVTSNT